MTVDYADLIEEADYPSVVANLRGRFAALPAQTVLALDENDDGLPGRLEMLLDHVLTVTSSAQAQLLPLQLLPDLNVTLEAVGNAMTAVEGHSRDSLTLGVVEQVKSVADRLALELAKWPPTAGGDWREAVTAAASTYRRSLGQQLGGLTTQADHVKAELISLREAGLQADAAHREALDARARDLESSIARIQASVDSLERNQTSIESQLTSSIARADQGLAAQQQQFSDAQEKRSEAAAAALAEVMRDSRRLLTAQETEAASLLIAIKQHVDEAANLVSVFAAAGTANAYSKEAKEQGETADSWRYGAIGLGVLSGVAAVTILFGISSGDKGWQLMIGKLAIALTFGGLAAYAARQSARHRQREESARQLELNLATFGALSEDLAETDLERARAQLVTTMLSRDTSGSDGLGAESLGPMQISLVERLLEIVAKQR